MKSILKVQKDGVNTLKDEILSHSNNKLKKLYVVVGEIKETGYDIVEECLIDLKARKFIAIGIDKKNTTRKMLDSVLKYTKNVYAWDNNGTVEFNSNIFVFEYEKESFVYLVQGSITDSLLDTDFNIYTKLVFDLEKDKKQYEEYIDIIVKEVKSSFVKLDKEYITELLDKKLIFTTKQYTHVIPSIAELLGKNENDESKKEEIEEENIKAIPKIQLSDISEDGFEIDLGDSLSFELDIETESKVDEKQDTNDLVETDAFGLNEQEYVEDEEEYTVAKEAIDMEALVLETEVIRIDKADIAKSNKKKENKLKQDAQMAKKINLDKVSNIIMQLSAKVTKGKDVNKIKVPNYIKDMIPNFFEVMENATVIKNATGEYKEAKIKLEVIDVNNSNKHVDGSAYIRQRSGGTFVEFESEALESVRYEELDIARIIKLATDYYHIEIIPSGIEEYAVWDKMCTNNFRGSNRQYGLM